jgi:hypothetical protein
MQALVPSSVSLLYQFRYVLNFELFMILYSDVIQELM